MAEMIYKVDDKPKFKELLIFALQQLLSIIAGTIAVPALIGLPNMMPAAILGSGIATLVYVFVTKRKSPVILSSNFAFIGALSMANNNYGFLGILLGGLLTGSVYLILSLIIKLSGTKWIDKIFPPVIIGPVVALIGLTLAVNAMSDLVTANGYKYLDASGAPYNLIALLCGLTTFFVVIICSGQNRNRFLSLTPFLMGIIVGFIVSLIFSAFGYIFDLPYLKIVDFTPLIDNFKELKVTSFINYPHFSLLQGIKEIASDSVKLNGIGILEIALAFMPISLVSFSEHIADHKNLGNIIGIDLIGSNPGLSRTLLADGLGSITGTFFGVCPVTTYSQTIGCVAMTKNASTITTISTALMCIILSFFTPLIVILQTIPSCVMAGICLALYGFIAVSGLNMLKGIDISGGKNLFTVSVILIAGIGGLVLKIPYQFGCFDGTLVYGVLKWIEISSISVALLLGILTYLISTKVEKHNISEEN